MLVCWPAMAAQVSTKNPHLQKALRLFDAFEYEESLRVLDKAEQWPANTPEDKVHIALLEGVLSYETQQPVRGERAFQRALELDRNAKLTLSVSPKVVEPPKPTPAEIELREKQRKQKEEEQKQAEEQKKLELEKKKLEQDK